MKVVLLAASRKFTINTTIIITVIPKIIIITTQQNRRKCDRKEVLKSVFATLQLTVFWTRFKVKLTSGRIKIILLEDNSGSLSGIIFAAFGVFVLVGGFGYQKYKREKIKKNENEAEKAENENLVDEKTAETRNELLSA